MRRQYSQACPGFTLIELVIVIVLVGILAALALPKFFNFKQNANLAKLAAIEGNLNAVASNWNAYAKLKDCPGGSSTVIKPDGTSLYLLACYPEAGDTIGVNEIDTLIDTNGYSVSLSSDSEHTYFDVPEAPSPSTCRADYRQAEDRGSYRPAIVTTVKTGC